MNREIRYRIRLQGEEGAPVLTIYPKLYDELNGLLHHPIDTNAWKILSVDEWTGMTDNNGMEIYEGDIFKHHQGVDIVHWDGCGFYVGSWEPGTLADFTGEVIGNIHENKELLK